MTPTLRLSDAQAALLREVAERAYPRECCGLLVGEGDEDVTLCEIVPMDNIAAAPERRFEIDPQGQFDLLRRLRGTARRIVGHYHSHPNGVGDLSAHDLSMAYDPTAVWLLIPVRDGRADTPRAFICPSPSAAVPMRIIAMAVQQATGRQIKPQSSP